MNPANIKTEYEKRKDWRRKRAHQGEEYGFDKKRILGGCTFPTCLNEPSGNKRQIIPRIKPMPKSTRSKRSHGTSKPGFLAPRCNPQINIILQPFIRILIPRLQQL